MFTVAEQAAMRDGSEVRVKVKRIWCPIEDSDSGDEKWIPLPVFRVIGRSPSGEEHQFTFNADTDTFAWRQPDKLEHPIIRIRGREYVDTLSPKRRVRGEQQKFDTVEEFTRTVSRFGGQAFADEVLRLLAHCV